MGRMDGIYVAFHNTQRIFGFQYISISEMDLALHGTEDRSLGDREFLLSLHLLNQVLDKAAKRFPGRSLRLHVETRPSDSAPFMYVFAKPVDAEEIQAVQEADKKSIAELEHEVVGLVSQEAESEGTSETVEEDEDGPEEDSYEEPENGYEQQLQVWEKLRHKVEETMDNEALGVESVRDTLEDALEQSGLLRARSAEESRRYVDALLHAITDPESEAVAKTLHMDSLGAVAVEDAGIDAIAVDVASPEEQAGDPGESAEATSASDDTTDQDVTQLDPDTEPSGSDTAAGGGEITHSGEKGTEDVVVQMPAERSAWAVSEEEDIVDEDQGAIDEDQEQTIDEVAVNTASRQSSLPIDNISLKSLILKLAEQIEATSGQEGEEDVAPGDTGPLETAKNKRFERILSEMVASAKSSSTSSTSLPAGTDKSGAAGAEPPPDKSAAPPEDLLGMVLTIRNKVHGAYMERPNATEFGKRSKWTVEYAIEELPPDRAQTLYEKCKERRKKLMRPRDNATAASRRFNAGYMKNLHRLSKEGRQFREGENAKAKSRPIDVYGFRKRLKWDDVFNGAESATKTTGDRKEW